jgi:hypothetical protein
MIQKKSVSVMTVTYFDLVYPQYNLENATDIINYLKHYTNLVIIITTSEI